MRSNMSSVESYYLLINQNDLKVKQNKTKKIQAISSPEWKLKIIQHI